MSFAELTISYPEVTRLCGYTVNPVFVGGTYRLSGGARNPAVISAYLVVAVSTFIVSCLPIATYVFRRSHAHWGWGLQLLVWGAISLGTIGLVLGCWQFFVRWQRCRLGVLLQLLTLIDRFNWLVQNVQAGTTENANDTDYGSLITLLAMVRTHLLLGVEIDQLSRTGQDSQLPRAHLARNWARIDHLDLAALDVGGAETVTEAVEILVTVNRCVGDRHTTS